MLADRVQATTSVNMTAPVQKDDSMQQVLSLLQILVTQKQAGPSRPEQNHPTTPRQQMPRQPSSLPSLVLRDPFVDDSQDPVRDLEVGLVHPIPVPLWEKLVISVQNLTIFRAFVLRLLWSNKSKTNRDSCLPAGHHQ